MPSLEDNQRIWRDYDWTSGGEEWSVNWGGAEMVWHGLVLPRLLPFLPARRALEIACGHGRFTRFLRGWVEGLQAVDLNPDCVVVCRERFRADSAVQVFEGDGLSLPMAEDGSVDLVFSYDSLVHADAPVLQAYLDEMARILEPDGVAFLHHSNVADLRDEELIERAQKQHFRDPTVSGSLMQAWAEARGLHVPVQEVIGWERGLFSDCISVVCRAESWRAQVRKRAVTPRYCDFGHYLNEVDTHLRAPFRAPERAAEET